jgi:ADP-heptose:LPS heptosyltransferase
MSVPSALRVAERQIKRLALGLARLLTRTRNSTPIACSRIQSILVVRQHNQLGDMLCVVPLLRALRARFPQSRIVLLASPVNVDVMRNHRLLDAVLNYDKREFLSHGRIRLVALGRFWKTLRRQQFDIAIVPATVSMSLTSDILAFVSGARWRIGPAALDGKENPGAFLYTHPVALNWGASPERHQMLRNFDIGRDLSLEVPALDPELTLLPDELEKGKLEVAGIRSGVAPVVAFHTGAGKIPNRWPAEGFARAIEYARGELGAAILVIKGPMDAEPVEALSKLLKTPFYLVENKSIREVASIIRSVDLLVSNDTGTMHVGAAAGTPVLSLFGPTDPRQWAPPGAIHRFIKSRSGVISDIPVQEVLDAMRQMLREHS